MGIFIYLYLFDALNIVKKVQNNFFNSQLLLSRLPVTNPVSVQNRFRNPVQNRSL